MRILITAGLILCLPHLALGQQPRDQRRNPASTCGDQSLGIPDFYYQAVVAQWDPPGFQKSLIRISEGAEIKIVIMTNGDKFEIWTDTPETPQKNVNRFLLNLDQACRLPPDPADAAKLIHVSWDSRALTSEEFAQEHEDFTRALATYTTKMQDRYKTLMATRMLSLYTDAIWYPIMYYNNHEQVEVEAWDVNTDPVANWVHQLKKLAEEKFRRGFITPGE